MKIQKIQAFPLAYPEPHYKGIERYITLARVESDDGLVGWGECISQFREATLATKIIIEQGFAPLLTGENGLDVERHWHKMLDRIWWYGPEGIAAFAVSAVDMALWDLKGKALGLPVCQLLGRSNTRQNRRNGIIHLRYGRPGMDAQRISVVTRAKLPRRQRRMGNAARGGIRSRPPA